MNLTAAKSAVALIGAVATALLGIYGPDSDAGQVLVVVIAVATAIATYVVPNAAAPGRRRRDLESPDAEIHPDHLAKRPPPVPMPTWDRNGPTGNTTG